MHIVICSSIDFTAEIEHFSDKLTKLGHTVDIPLTSQRIINKEITLDEYFNEKSNAAESAQRKIKDDVIRGYFNRINNANAIFVLNLEKKGIPNYIGGNTFLEMGFAHVLNKANFLYNGVPELSYTDEILAFQPIIVSKNLSLISDS